MSIYGRSYSEEEKMRRWQEIKVRQHRLRAEVDNQTTPAHIEQIMKSGFSMSDIKGKIKLEYNIFT